MSGNNQVGSAIKSHLPRQRKIIPVHHKNLFAVPQCGNIRFHNSSGNHFINGRIAISAGNIKLSLIIFNFIGQICRCIPTRNHISGSMVNNISGMKNSGRRLKEGQRRTPCGKTPVCIGQHAQPLPFNNLNRHKSTPHPLNDFPCYICQKLKHKTTCKKLTFCSDLLYNQIALNKTDRSVNFYEYRHKKSSRTGRKDACPLA